MGVPNYVPNQKAIGDSDYYWKAKGSPNGSPGSWEQTEAKRVQDEANATNYRNNQILSRGAAALTDTTPYQQQIAASRDMQMQSLGNLQKSAMGLGPSYANAQASQALGQGLGKLNMGAPNALAFRNNIMAGNQALGNIAAEGSMARNKELGAAMNAYGTGAQAIRGGDITGQQAAAQQIGRQRDLYLQNAKGNQGYVQTLEGLDMDKNLALSKDAQDWYNQWVQRNAAQGEQNAKETQAAIQTMMTVMALAASDRRVKKDVR